VTCPLCETEVEPDDDYRPLGTPEGTIVPAHRECLLRSGLGGIGHLTDHHYWCVQRGDPDGGHSYRESALLVDEWVTSHRVP
jgi:hypothetical protein